MKDKLILWTLVFILLVSSVSALEIDNAKNYEEELKTITVYNYLGLVPEWLFDTKLAEYTLTYNTNYCVRDCYAEGLVTLYKEDKLFSKMEFINNKQENENLPYNIYYYTNESYEETIQNYELICNTFLNKTTDKNDEICNWEIVGNHKEIKYKWVEHDYNGEELQGFYKWKIEGKKINKGTIDWVGSAIGERFTEWAFWNDYTYKRNITLEIASNMTVAVNNTNGVFGQTVWINPYDYSGTIALYYEDGNDWTLSNGTDAVNYEIDESGTGVNPTTIYGTMATWHLGNSSGLRNGTDSSTKGNDLTCSATQCPAIDTTAPFGTGADFDGDNDAYTRSADVDFNAGKSDWTISTWFKQSDTTELYTIFMEWDGNVYIYFGHDTCADNKKNCIYISDGTGTSSMNLVADGNINIKDGNWHNIVITQSGQHFYTYIDGVDRGDNPLNTLDIPLSAIRFGEQSNNGNEIHGSLDEIRYWNGTQLSAIQINEMYNNSLDGINMVLGEEEEFISVPVININFPFNNTYTFSKQTNFTYNVTDNDGTINNCSLWLQKGGIWEENITDTSITETINQTFNITLAIENINWTVGCWDNNNYQRNATKYNYSRITILPVTELNYPENNTYFETRYINFTYNSSIIVGTIDTCYLWLNNSALENFQLNKTDTSITQLINQTFNITLNNNHNLDWLVECESNEGYKANSSIRSFKYNSNVTIPTTITPVNNTITVTNSKNLSCSGATDLNSDVINYEFWTGITTATMTIQQNSSLTTYNMPFTTPNNHYFKCKANDNLSASSFTDIRKITYAQLYANCSASNDTSLIILNFSFADENKTKLLEDFEFEATFNYWGNDSNDKQVLSFDGTIYNETHYCLSPKNTSIYSDITIKYSKTGYDERSFTEYSRLITNYTNHTVLYLLGSSSSTTITIHVSDYDDNKLQSYTAEALLYSLGTDSYSLVQSELTNFNGEAIFNLDSSNEYSFNVKDTDGLIVYTSGKFKPVETDYYFRIDTSEGIEIDIIRNIRSSIDHSLGWDNKSKNASWYVFASSTLVSSSCITLKRIDLNNDTVIDRTCSPIASSVNSSYHYDDENATFMIEGSVFMISNGLEYILERQIVDLTIGAIDFGKEGVFWAMLITIVFFLVGVALRSPEMTIIMLDVGLIFSKVTRLMPMKWTNLMGVIVVTIIILVLVRKKEGVYY